MQDNEALNSNTLSEMKVMLARVEERQIASTKHMEKLATIEKVATLEEDLDHKVDQSTHNTLDDRVGRLESNQTWIGRMIFGAIILAVLNLLGLGGKIPWPH